jgi:hypothetical protein
MYGDMSEEEKANTPSSVFVPWGFVPENGGLPESGGRFLSLKEVDDLLSGKSKPNREGIMCDGLGDNNDLMDDGNEDAYD